MGFLSGSTTFERWWVVNDPTPPFGSEHIDALERFAIGQFKTSTMDQPNVGFLAGDHLLDVRFDLAKNRIGHSLHFGVRIDTDQIPAAMRNAWLQMELLPHTVDNPSGRPTKAQRQEAKEAVAARCEEEARSGRFRRMKQIPVLWDAEGGIVYIGASNPGTSELCVDLLERAFELELDHITTGKLAASLADQARARKSLEEAVPSQFHAKEAAAEICWWNGQSGNYDFLGNEFLLWLWWYWETQSDTMGLSDGSEVTGMFARTLSLECPRGESGKETIAAECPIVLPEAALAIRSGKLPRKAGLTLVRHGQQYDLTIQAETFAVGGARIQMSEESDPENYREDRLGSIYDLSETLEFLFTAFFQQRIGKSWQGELKKMRRWLQS